MIEKNPNLCYVETIRWDYITKKGDNNFIAVSLSFFLFFLF